MANSTQGSIEMEKQIKTLARTAILTVAMLGITACGGSGEVDPIGVTTGKDGKEIIVGSSNANLTYSPSNKDTVEVTGSNNKITIKTRPKKLIVTGNDNYIETPMGTQTERTGTGNVIKIISDG